MKGEYTLYVLFKRVLEWLWEGIERALYNDAREE